MEFIEGGCFRSNGNSLFFSVIKLPFLHILIWEFEFLIVFSQKHKISSEAIFQAKENKMLRQVYLTTLIIILKVNPVKASIIPTNKLINLYGRLYDL